MTKETDIICGGHCVFLTQVHLVFLLNITKISLILIKMLLKSRGHELVAEKMAAGLASARVRTRKGGRPYKMKPIKLRLAMESMGRPKTNVLAQ